MGRRDAPIVREIMRKITLRKEKRFFEFMLIAGVMGIARSFDMPPVAYATEPHAGSLPASMDLLKLADSEMATTTVQVQDDQIKCRLYSVHETSAEVKMEANELSRPVLRSLDGEEIQQLKPFQIGTVTLDNKE